MKKILLVIALFAFVSFTINAQTKSTDTQKKAPVEKKAPVAKKKSSTASKKTIIDVTKLPQEILDNLKTHQGFKAVKAWSTTSNGVLTYVVTDNKVNYTYDKDKKFVKEEAVKEVAKPAVKKEEPKKETKPADAKPVK